MRTQFAQLVRHVDFITITLLLCAHAVRCSSKVTSLCPTGNFYWKACDFCFDPTFE
jgi:hypothetical protein